MGEEQISETYKNGFNGGYILSKHEQKLLSNILKADNPSNEFIKAVKAGQKQYELEKSLQYVRQSNKGQAKDYGPEI